MSHAATNWAIKQKGLKPATKIVLWHLCDRHNPDLGCFPKQEVLAADCEMSRSTLNLHLAKLEELGLIRRDAGREEGSMKHRPTRYWLAFEADNSMSENRTIAQESVSENRTESVSENRTKEPKTVSEKHEKPCPNFGENRVRKSDTNLVRGTSKGTSKPRTDVGEVLSEVLSPEAVAAYLDHRKAKRAKITPRAAELIVDRLRGHPTPDAVVLLSIENGWTGIFPEKVRPPDKPRPADDRMAKWQKLAAS
jgi:DNA-binding transcriptional ArsR family regulator